MFLLSLSLCYVCLPSPYSYIPSLPTHTHTHTHTHRHTYTYTYTYTGSHSQSFRRHLQTHSSISDAYNNVSSATCTQFHGFNQILTFAHTQNTMSGRQACWLYECFSGSKTQPTGTFLRQMRNSLVF